MRTIRGWPYDGEFARDPRPIDSGAGRLLRDHADQQTDVRFEPGLRDIWMRGQAEPESAFSRACAPEYRNLDPIKPGLVPGGWSFKSIIPTVLLGGSIWASHDDAFYFSDTNMPVTPGITVSGAIDSWRRPKPEWFLARHIFSPVWLETRHADFTPGRSLCACRWKTGTPSPISANSSSTGRSPDTKGGSSPVLHPPQGGTGNTAPARGCCRRPATPALTAPSGAWSMSRSSDSEKKNPFAPRPSSGRQPGAKRERTFDPGHRIRCCL